MVNGRPFPPRYIHIPHSSFTAGATATDTTEGIGTDAADGRVSSPEYPLQDLTATMQELVDEEVAGACAELVEQCVAEVSLFTVYCYLSVLCVLSLSLTVT